MAEVVDLTLEVQLKRLQLNEVRSTGKIIGRGAYGRVIEAYVHGTLCAAKEIHPALVENVSPRESEAIRKSFCEECVKSSTTSHPNIVQVLGIYYPPDGKSESGKLPWLVMELMETSLKGFLEKYGRGEVPLHFKLSILVDIAQGLEFLHGQDVVHRDLSSNNVLLTKQLVAKIADLGVSKVIEQNKMKTQTQTPGTPHFMPPEALSVKPRYGKPVDVFSLACIALHVMSHQWPEPTDRVQEVDDKMIALTEVQRREKYFHFISESTLKQLVESCLHNKPEKRPKVSNICVRLKELKQSTDKKVPFSTASNFELFNAVQKISQLEALIQEKDIIIEELQAYKASTSQHHEKKGDTTSGKSTRQAQDQKTLEDFFNQLLAKRPAASKGPSLVTSKPLSTDLTSKDKPAS